MKRLLLFLDREKARVMSFLCLSAPFAVTVGIALGVFSVFGIMWSPLSAAVFILLALAYGAAIIAAVERETAAVVHAAGYKIKRLKGLVSVLNQAVVLLLAADEDKKTFDEALQTCMQTMASAFDIDWIVIWENDDAGNQYMAANWYNDAGKKFAYKAEIEGLADRIPCLAGWRERLARNERVKFLLSSLPKKERQQIGVPGLLSLIFIPVCLEGKFRGFVGFGCCLQEPEFTRNEEDVLLSGSLLMVKAMAANAVAAKAMAANAVAGREASKKTWNVTMTEWTGEDDPHVAKEEKTFNYKDKEKLDVLSDDLDVLTETMRGMLGSQRKALAEVMNLVENLSSMGKNL